jgi:hypothetical protein
MSEVYERVSAEHARKEIMHSAQEAVNELEEGLASAIYKAAEGTIDNKVVAMSAERWTHADA